MPRINEQHRRDVSCEHGLDKLVKPIRSARGESEAGQINQVERRARSARDPVDVGEPRLAGSGARSRDTLADQRIDQARFADVRPPDDRDFRQAILRKVARGGGTRDEFSGNLQWVIGSMMAPTGSACVSAGRRPASGSVNAIFRTSSMFWTI